MNLATVASGIQNHEITIRDSFGVRVEGYRNMYNYMNEAFATVIHGHGMNRSLSYTSFVYERVPLG